MVLVLLVCCVLAAWYAQSAVHVQTGKAVPPAGEYGLPGVWDEKLVLMGGTAALRVYLPAMIVFAVAGTLLWWRAGTPRILRPFHLDEEDSCALRRRPGVRSRRIHAAAGALSVAGFLFCLVHALASTRADLFPAPNELMSRSDRLLRGYYALLGLKVRPNWWSPLVCWMLLTPLAVASVHAIGRALGFGWDVIPAGGGVPARRWWEWLVAGAVAAVALGGYLHGIEDRPWVIQQDEGIVGRGGYHATKAGSQTNIFHDDMQPYPAFVTRGLAAHLAGNRHEPLRYTSALTGALGLLAAWWAIRGFVGFTASIGALVLLAANHTVIQYSRIGINNIDGMYWIFLLLGVFQRAEVAPAGLRRLCLYVLAGGVGGAAVGLYTGVVLGTLAVCGVMGIRVLFQRGFWRSRWVGVAGFLLMAGVMASPFLANPKRPHDRAGLVSVLGTRYLSDSLNSPLAREEGIDSAPELVAYFLPDALGGYHWRRDKSHDYSSPFPLSGPLLGALSALGAAVLAVRFRSWASMLLAGLYIGGALLGGAMVHSPLPPSSARLLMILPAVVLAAAIGIETLVAAARFASDRLPGSIRTRRTCAGIAACAGVLLLVCELDINLRLYGRFLGDRMLLFNTWMSDSTQMQRFIQDHAPEPDQYFHLGIDDFSNQTYIHNDYLLPESFGRRFYIGPKMRLTPDRIKRKGVILVAVHRTRLGELEDIRDAFPGGREFRSVPPPWGESNYVFYEFWKF